MPGSLPFLGIKHKRKNDILHRMFELFITNTLKSLVFPPGGILLLILLGLLLLKRKTSLANAMLWGGLISGYLLSTPLVSTLLLQPLQPYPALTESEIHQTSAQAIVVLSAGRDKNAPEYGGDTVGSNTLLRVRYGAFVHRLTGLPIVVSGGHVFDGEGDSLAQVMANSLRDDFHIDNVWLEDESRTTGENAIFTHALLKEKNIDTVFLVTHAVHMPRSVAIFEQVGLKVIPAPTRFVELDHKWFMMLFPDSSALGNSYMALHEMVGRLWYSIRY